MEHGGTSSNMLTNTVISRVSMDSGDVSGLLECSEGFGDLRDLEKVGYHVVDLGIHHGEGLYTRCEVVFTILTTVLPHTTYAWILYAMVEGIRYGSLGVTCIDE